MVFPKNLEDQLPSPCAPDLLHDVVEDACDGTAEMIADLSATGMPKPAGLATADGTGVLLREHEQPHRGLGFIARRKGLQKGALPTVRQRAQAPAENALQPEFGHIVIIGSEQFRISTIKPFEVDGVTQLCVVLQTKSAVAENRFVPVTDIVCDGIIGMWNLREKKKPLTAFPGMSGSGMRVGSDPEVLAARQTLRSGAKPPKGTTGPAVPLSQTALDSRHDQSAPTDQIKPFEAKPLEGGERPNLTEKFLVGGSKRKIVAIGKGKLTKNREPEEVIIIQRGDGTFRMIPIKYIEKSAVDVWSFKRPDSIKQCPVFRNRGELEKPYDK
jgi:hypothetical protein